MTESERESTTGATPDTREMGEETPALTVTLTRRAGAGRPERRRTLRLSRRAWRRACFGAGVLLFAGLAFVASWGYLLLRSAQLNEEVALLQEDRERVTVLAAALDEVEEAYERIRALYGPEVLGTANEAWLPPAAGRASVTPSDDSQPTTWPLTRRGFLTQPLLDDAGPSHPGIDVAIPAGSYIRSAGPGRVVEAAEHGVYGLYLVVDHGDGYTSLYAHAQRLLVLPGDEVRRGEVIALSGSTGRSTAPHLHFEIRRDGEQVDPLTLVQAP